MEVGGGFPGSDSAVADAVSSMHAAIDELVKLQADATDVGILALVPELEVAARRTRSLQLQVMGTVTARGLYGRDGHGSPRVFERHTCKLSGAEAAARHQTRRVVRDLPDVGTAYADGEIGTAQVDLLGRVYANRRVRAAMVERQARFVADARALPFRRFEAGVRRWERLTDQDGAEPEADKTHQQRDVTLIQDFNTSWVLSGSFGSLHGAEMADIFAHYTNAELLADWEHARGEHGDDATEEHLPRTPPQRRADALARIFDDAAAFDGTPVPAATVHTILWSSETFEEMVKRLDPARDPVPFDVDTFRCETVDGAPLDPHDAFADALVSQFRRAVIDAKGVTIDLGTARLFTGSARAAVQLHATECVWPGCETPTSRCQTDHLTPHAKQGRTNPGNGAPLCGRHNRLKDTGNYRVWRDPTGTWHTQTPNGREIG